MDQHADGHTYRAARPLGEKADAVEFKIWTVHCRLIYAVRVDWAAGKLSPAQECVGTAADPGEGCQYKILPEDKLYADGITFVRLWPSPAENPGQPMKTVVKKDSKVDLLTARVAVRWAEGTSAFAPGSQGPLDDVVSVAPDKDADLWLKVRIDGKEGWMHSEEDFRALGLPEDE